MTASEYVREHHPSALTDATQRHHFHRSMFHGYDFDNVMLRIGSMNMLLHSIESPDIRYRDSLSEGASDDAERYSLILANPPFAGSLDAESVSKNLQRTVKSKKTELLFLALFLQLLDTGGRAAVIVPDGVLFGSSKAHRELRRMLVEDQKLDAIVKLPSGVFKPYAGVSTAIVFFTRTDSGGTDDVWFYDVRADGFSLDDKRNPIEADDLPDVLARWQSRDPEQDRACTDQSFLVPKADIVAQGYDLSLNRYKEVVHDEVEHRPPLEIIADLEIQSVGYSRHYKFLRELSVPRPDLDEQRRIAVVLSHAERLQRSRRGVLTRLEGLVRLIYREGLGSHRVEVRPLGDFADVRTGSTPPRSDPENFGGEVPWVKTGEVAGLITRTSEHVTERGIAAGRLRVFPAGSVVVAMYGEGQTRGRSAILGVDATTNQACAVIIRGDAFDPLFLQTQLAVSYDRLRGRAEGGSQANLSLKRVHDFTVIIPPMAEQLEFAVKARAVAAQRRRVELAAKGESGP